MTSINTIRTDAYNAMNLLLTDATYGITTSNIHSRYNDKNALQEGYPQVIIKPIITRHSEGFRRNGQWAYVNYEILVYHNSPENARTVADEIDNKIRNAPNSLLKDKGFRYKDDEDISEDIQEVYAGTRRVIQIVSMNFPFQYRQKMN